MSLFIRTRAFFRRQYFKRLSGNYSQMEGKPYLSQPLLIIGENVFIGDNVMILKGVNIGKNSVIGAGSLVCSDIPESMLAAGNPCHVIRTLT